MPFVILQVVTAVIPTEKHTCKTNSLLFCFYPSHSEVQFPYSRQGDPFKAYVTTCHSSIQNTLMASHLRVNSKVLHNLYAICNLPPSTTPLLPTHCRAATMSSLLFLSHVKRIPASDFCIYCSLCLDCSILAPLARLMAVLLISFRSLLMSCPHGLLS